MTSEKKKKTLTDFHDHVSSGKADFWRFFDMELVMAKREGPFFWDIDGKRYLNLHGNGGVFNLGHRHPEVIRALTEALEEVDIGNGHLISRARAELGRKLADLMPDDLDYAVFGSGGGEAVDLAFKTARAHTGRPKIISAQGGYHGHTGLALAAGDEKYRAPFGPQAPGFVQVPFDDIEALDRELDDRTAAVILETVPATLGVRVPSPGYLAEVRRLCDQKGALLIIDEVQTGLGRTGKLWAFEHFGILPDMVILGKGLSGGVYPITAAVLRKPLDAVFRPDPHIHISTFGGSELGCLTALKVLEISSAPSFLKHVNRLADLFRDGLAGLVEKHSVLVEHRRLGLFMGLKLEDEHSGPIMAKAAYENGLFMVYANNDKSVNQLLPPLTLTEDLVDFVLDGLDRSLTLVQEFKNSL